MSNSTSSNLALQEQTRREILHKSDLIPSLPEFVVRLLGLLNRPETEPRDLERQLQGDPVLVAKMLAMVNSPFYGLGRSVRTIKDAVMVLGFRGVRSLVLATSTARFLQHDYACYGHDQRGLWKHSACVAAAARHVAHSCKLALDTAEALFVAGLLHDIGKLLLLPYLNEALRKHPGTATMTTDLEYRLIGIDHTEAGALVAAKWNLSIELQEVLKAHHDETAMGHKQSIAIVRLADAMAHEGGIGYLPGKAPAPRYLPHDLAALGLVAPAWDAMHAEIRPIMTAAAASLADFAS